jgi:hypothetical protein
MSPYTFSVAPGRVHLRRQLKRLWKQLFRAISARLSGDKAFAHASPPFKPPDRANSCAGVGGGYGFGSSRLRLSD